MQPVQPKPLSQPFGFGNIPQPLQPLQHPKLRLNLPSRNHLANHKFCDENEPQTSNPLSLRSNHLT